MKREEHAATVTRGKLRAVVKAHLQWRPVPGETDDRFVVGGVVVVFAIVTAVFGREHAGLFDRIPISVRPAEVRALLEQVKFLGHALGVVKGIVVGGINGVELVAAHHAHEKILRYRLPLQRDTVPLAGRETHTVGSSLVGLAGIELPESAVGFLKFRHLLRIETFRAELPVRLAVIIER